MVIKSHGLKRDYWASPLMEKRASIRYETGDKVRVILGQYAGQVLTVRSSENAYVVFQELPRRIVMSKGNVEPLAPL